MELATRSVDSLLHGRKLVPGETCEIAPNLLFRRQGQIKFLPNARNVVGRSGLNAEARAFLSRPQAAQPDLPTGIFEMRDVLLAPPYGMILDLNNQCCWTGSRLGWSERDFQKSEKPDNFTALEKAIRFDLPKADDIHELETAVLTSAPHYFNYGHWLLEFLPRIDLALSAGFGDLPLYAHPGQDWSETLARCLGPVNFVPHASASASFTRVKRLIVPSVARIQNSGDDVALKAAWARLSDGLAHMAPAPDPFANRSRGRKIAVSRRGWTNSVNLRRLINTNRMERMLVDQGFEIHQPHTMSLADQRNLFHDADVIVGEDGSALHNTIYSRPGTRIGLVAMGRINYLHLLTAAALGHWVTFIPTEISRDHEANWFLEIYRLRPRELLSSLAELLQFGGLT